MEARKRKEKNKEEEKVVEEGNGQPASLAPLHWLGWIPAQITPRLHPDTNQGWINT